MNYEIIGSYTLNLYLTSKVWSLIGDYETLEVFKPRGDFFLAVMAGLGSEAWNGYFIELGYAGTTEISSVYFRSGKRFHW